MNNNNQVVWITGASSGIGEALVYQYAEKGFKLIISARREEILNQVKNKCAQPTNVFVLPLDLTQSKTFEDKVSQAINKFGRIDVLVNNGGISQRSNAFETTEEVDRKVMEVNYFGNIALAKALLPHFKKNRAGHIVVLSSLTGLFGFFLRSAYAASKHALHGFYESLRLEEEKNGLKVSLICPGFIKTDISKNAIVADGTKLGVMDNNQANGMSPEECARQIIKAQVSNKKQIVIGKEKYGVLLLRFFPALFWKILKTKPER